MIHTNSVVVVQNILCFTKNEYAKNMKKINSIFEFAKFSNIDFVSGNSILLLFFTTMLREKPRAIFPFAVYTLRLLVLAVR